MTSHPAHPLEPALGRLAFSSAADVRMGSALMRSLRHVLLALIMISAMPAAAQLSGGGGSAVLMQMNVESVVVEGTFLRNGRPFPADVQDSGNVYIESKDGDPIFLGNTSNGIATGPRAALQPRRSVFSQLGGQLRSVLPT